MSTDFESFIDLFTSSSAANKFFNFFCFFRFSLIYFDKFFFFHKDRCH